MEFDLPLVFIPLLFLLVSHILRVVMKSTTNYSKLLNQIPGPRKLPLIGNMHLLAGNPTPHKTLRDLSLKHGPLMHLQLGELPFLIVSSVEVAKQVLRTHDITFANRPPGLAPKTLACNYTDIAFAPYGEYWRHLRKICTLELLSVRRVQSFRPIRVEENLNLAKWIASYEGSPANLSESVHQLSYDITTRASLGQKTKDQGTLLASLIKECGKLAAGLSIADLFPSIKLLPWITGIQFKIHRIDRDIQTTFDSIIKEHRVANNGDIIQRAKLEDLADVLLKYQEDGDELHLTDGNITAVIMDMFIAGSETSAAAVEWAMSEMIRNPSTLKKAQEEVRKLFDDKGYVDEAKFHELIYFKLVIRETLRLHPPLPLLVPRINSERCEVNGYEIPAETRLMVNAWALGRDPKYWYSAEEFIPERFEGKSIDYKGNNLEYIPFGSGRRLCPGMSFGLANVEYTLAMLLYHFDWEMPNGIRGEELDMMETTGLIVKRKHDLLIIPTVKRPLEQV